MGELINLNRKVNWVKWLEERKLAMMPTPFDIYMEECVKAGITAIVQPGGSIKDQLSIDACDEAGIAMIFVGDRHFKH